MPDLPPGLYEDLLTSALEAQLQSIMDRVEQSPLDRAEAPDRLALHVTRLVEQTIRSLPADQRVAAGTDIVRMITQLLGEEAGIPVDDLEPSGTGFVLHAVHPVAPDGRPLPLQTPLIPVLDTTLLNNAPGEPALSKQLLSEIESADRVDAMIAFIRFSGIRPFLERLRRHTASGKILRVLTTTYTGSTEPRALDALADLGAEIRVSYDTSTTRLHAKAWVFHRDAGSSTAYIGSSNLTHSAQVVGLEWNVRISGRRNPGVLQKAQAAYDSAWENGDFVPYDPSTFARAVQRQDKNEPQLLLPPVELRLEPFQDQLLEQVAASRERGFHRNLLVAATGTGKTVMAAVDYARLARRLPRARLLFVAHREELLDQALRTFRYALRQPAFGEKFVGGHRPRQWDHVFASIQSIGASGVDNLDPQHFDVVIVDEFHHAAAPSYDQLLQRLTPTELLGLTATPDRADGMPILHWFGGRIAAELRLWDAIDQQRLAPFHYYGLHDGLDLRAVGWRRGRGYDTAELSNLVTGDQVLARRVIEQVSGHVPDVQSMRALGFCVSIDHAQFMAQQFRETGIAATAVTGQTPDQERRDALRQLADGELQAVFSVDLFNEGIDIPDVDTLLMLRPTDSATVFVQQLGRGLRRSPGKSVCTVLDFVGYHRAEFRYDMRFAALVGGTRKELEQKVAEDFPYLPTGCHLTLDPVAKDIVLASIRNALPSRWPQLVAKLTAMVQDGHDPTLSNYLHHTGLALDDVYSNNRSWSDLLQSAGLPVAPAGPEEVTLRRAIGRQLHIDDLERIGAFRHFLAQPNPPQPDSPRQAALLRMLVVALAGRHLKDADLAEGADLLWRHPQVRAEYLELLDLLADRPDHLQPPLPNRPDVPLLIHARYTREEILAALHQKASRAKTPPWREGVYWAADQQADVFVVTIDKSAGHFSPTTLYRDYAISRDLFHWESQSTTAAESPTGRRYRNHASLGSEILLFARQTNRDRSFWFLGRATYVAHEGQRPMAITWRLHHPLSGDLYAQFAATAVA